jgi:hypothetical protein
LLAKLGKAGSIAAPNCSFSGNEENRESSPEMLKLALK